MSIRRLAPTLLIAAGLFVFAGCKSTAPERSSPVIHYLEIVTPNVDAACATYAQIHGLTFGQPDAAMGQARLAQRSDGGLVGIRAPLAAHEDPIMRTYLAVTDIAAAAKAVEARGAVLAYPPTSQGDHGTFAIYIEGGVQHGLWQR